MPFAVSERTPAKARVLLKKLLCLLGIEAIALATLALIAAALAAYGAVSTAANPAAILSPGSAAWITFAYTCVLGAVPVALLGAPVYWWLLQDGEETWTNALLLGTAPALVFLLAGLTWGFLALMCGSAVSLTTHAVCRGWCSNATSSESHAPASASPEKP